MGFGYKNCSNPQNVFFSLSYDSRKINNVRQNHFSEKWKEGFEFV